MAIARCVTLRTSADISAPRSSGSFRAVRCSASDCLRHHRTPRFTNESPQKTSRRRSGAVASSAGLRAGTRKGITRYRTKDPNVPSQMRRRIFCWSRYTKALHESRMVCLVTPCLAPIAIDAHLGRTRTSPSRATPQAQANFPNTGGLAPSTVFVSSWSTRPCRSAPALAGNAVRPGPRPAGRYGL